MNHELVLLKDVARLGAEGDIVKVKLGYARNYLLPRGLAAIATPQLVALAETAKRQRAQQTQRLREQADVLKRRLEGQSLTMTLTLGADDTPFGSVTAHDLYEALKQAGFDVAKHDIKLEHPLKTLGAFDVPVKVHADMDAILKVVVVKA